MGISSSSSTTSNNSLNTNVNANSNITTTSASRSRRELDNDNIASSLSSLSSLSSYSMVSSSSAKKQQCLAMKLGTATKTGVLNIANLELKLSSMIWNELISSASISSKLKMLDCSQNELKSLPLEITQLPCLKTLVMHDCNLHRMSNLHLVTTLTKLDISRNDLEGERIKSLPTSLVKLKLASNHCTEIPRALTGLIHLVELDLSMNRLMSTNGLGALVSVVVLILDNNELQEISDDVAQCVQLKHLSVKHNRIAKHSGSDSAKQSIPAELLCNSSLERIDMQGNSLLRNMDLMEFDGMNVFLERRQASKEKQLHQGALSSASLFGLDR